MLNRGKSVRVTQPYMFERDKNSQEEDEEELLGAQIVTEICHDVVVSIASAPHSLPNLPKSPSPHVYSSPSSLTAALCL